jgi:hypothetical protein
MSKLPDIFRYLFLKEGVVHSMEQLATLAPPTTTTTTTTSTTTTTTSALALASSSAPLDKVEEAPSAAADKLFDNTQMKTRGE